MIKMIRVEKEEDSLRLLDDKIIVDVGSKEYIYELSTVNSLVLLTTDEGPLNDDVGLAIDVGNNDVIFILSEHKCFSPFLFDQIGKALPIDYQKVIDASACTENNIFEIYVKER